MNRVVTHGITMPIEGELVDLKITVDLDRLINRMGPKAWRNVSKRSTVAWSHVVVKARKAGT